MADSSEISNSDRGIRQIVLIYAVCALLWIVLSDRVLVWLFDDHAVLMLASMFKGWLFIAVTSLLLYGLLRQRRALVTAAEVQRSQEERLRALNLLGAIADGSNDAIFAKDLEGRYILFNRAAGRFVGQAPEDVLGRDDRAIFPLE